MVGKQIVVVVVGLPGSGKSIVAGMLAKTGFEVIELGDIWRELLKKNNIDRSDPIGTREFTRELREREGKEVYAKYAYKRIRKGEKLIAIMGVRSDYESNYFRKRIKNLYIIALLAPPSLRFDRLKTRGKPEDPKTIKSFKWLDQRERQGFMKEKSEERHGVVHVMEDADYVIANTSTVGKLQGNVAKVIKEIKKLNQQ